MTTEITRFCLTESIKGVTVIGGQTEESEKWHRVSSGDAGTGKVGVIELEDHTEIIVQPGVENIAINDFAYRACWWCCPDW